VHKGNVSIYNSIFGQLFVFFPY